METHRALIFFAPCLTSQLGALVWSAESRLLHTYRVSAAREVWKAVGVSENVAILYLPNGWIQMAISTEKLMIHQWIQGYYVFQTNPSFLILDHHLVDGRCKI